jgi:Arc/MetJ family transcription regulator
MDTLPEVTMRLKIDIDNALLNEAFSCSQARTVEELIHMALEEFIRIRKRKDLTELAGRIKLRKDYDHKAMRTLRG